MKWGGKNRVKFALIPKMCNRCERWMWLERIYHDEVNHNLCIPCDIERELLRNQANAAIRKSIS